MKKISYRDKLLELAYIYNVKEIQDYTNNRKNLTTGQIELILKKIKLLSQKNSIQTFLKKTLLSLWQSLSQILQTTKKKKLKTRIDFLEKLKIINMIHREK